MATQKLTVQNEHGIHARVARRIVEKTREIPAKVTVSLDNKKADGGSIIDLLLLGANQGSSVVVDVIGEDDEKYLRDIALLFTDGGGI
jgi:phosphotransferase system HPr (HPr) family protein